MKNWKTTMAGIGALLSAIGPAIVGIAHGDYAAVSASLPGIVAGIGLICAKDDNVTGGSVRQ